MIRRAAAIILTRGKDPELEVLLVERDPRLRFFGGFFAFPGGTMEVDEGKVDEGQVDEGTGDLAAAFRRCGVRELFEETGVLLVPGEVSADEREGLRRGLAGKEPDPASTSRWATVDTGGALLTSVMQITTPAFTPRRYETEFFLAALPPGEEVAIWPGELVGGEFIRPADALRDWREGKRLIAPPVLLQLELLVEHGVQGLPAAARAEQDALAGGKLHPVRFAPGIFTAPLETETLPPATTTNCFLLGHERVLIIDPAPTEPSEQERLFAKIDAVRKAGAELLAVALTHHHLDHVGAVVTTCKRYELPLWAHRETLDRIDTSGLEVQALEDRDTVELGASPDGREEWMATVLHTPGHAPGHLAFVEDRYRGAVVGDLLSAISTIVLDPPDGHLATYLASLERLESHGVGMVHPSHGPAVRTGTGMIRHFLHHRRERHDKVRAALGEEPRDLESLVAEVYDDTDSKLWPLAKRSLLAHLIALEENGEARREGDAWSVREDEA